MSAMDSITKITMDNEQGFSDYEEVTYVYETPETGLFESKVLIEGLEFASVESLNKEM